MDKKTRKRMRRRRRNIIKKIGLYRYLKDQISWYFPPFLRIVVLFVILLIILAKTVHPIITVFVLLAGIYTLISFLRTATK